MDMKLLLSSGGSGRKCHQEQVPLSQEVHPDFRAHSRHHQQISWFDMHSINLDT